MFEKTLQDVVKGIRANKRDPSDFISTAIAEIKVELRSSDAFVKAQAVRSALSERMHGRIGKYRNTEIRDHPRICRPEYLYRLCVLRGCFQVLGSRVEL